MIDPKSNGDCVASAVLRKADGKTCDTQALPQRYNEWVEVSPNSWLFYSSHKETGWYRCAASRDRIEESIGILKMQGGCSVETPDRVILEAIANVEERNIFLIPESEMVDLAPVLDVSLNINITKTEPSTLNVTDAMLVPIIDPATMFHSEGFWVSVGHWLTNVTVLVLTVGAGVSCVYWIGQRKNAILRKRSILAEKAENIVIETLRRSGIEMQEMPTEPRAIQRTQTKHVRMHSLVQSVPSEYELLHQVDLHPHESKVKLRIPSGSNYQNEQYIDMLRQHANSYDAK